MRSAVWHENVNKRPKRSIPSLPSQQKIKNNKAKSWNTFCIEDGDVSEWIENNSE